MRLSISLALLSAAILAFQIALIQILSCIQWYHFAYMIISVALLGFGAAGTFLTLFRNWLITRSDQLLPVFMFLSSLFMAGVVPFSQSSLFRFDSYLVLASWEHVFKLLFSYLLFFIPFFFGALPVGMIFTQHVHQIGPLYFANLLGSAAGVVVAFVMTSFFLPEQHPSLAAIPAVVAGLILLKNTNSWHWLMALGSLAVNIAMTLFAPALNSSQFKDISRALQLPGANKQIRIGSPQGLLEVVASPALRYAPGLSLLADTAPPIQKAVFINGNWLGPLIDFNNKEFASALEQTTMALPFVLNTPSRILLLQAGTGVPAAQALYHQAGYITMVESNKAVMELVQQQIEKDPQLKSEKIKLVATEPRTFLMRDTSTYDLILLPFIGTFGGSAGIYAAMEQYHLTVEAFRLMWERLTADGMIGLSCWMDYPPRHPIKLFATAATLLEEKQKSITHHLAAIRSWGTLTLLIKKSPLTESDVKHIRLFCDSLQFDPLWLPDINRSEQNRYHQLQDTTFFAWIDSLASPARERLFAQYDFRIKPATDNQPYFSQFLRWASIGKLTSIYGGRLPFFEAGYLIILLTLGQIALAAVLLIVLPLFGTAWQSRATTGVLLFFSGIGLGFMFVEIVLIQQLILYLGNAVYATIVSIACLLIFSGMGSLLSGVYARPLSNRLPLVPAVIALLIFTLSVVLPALIQQTIGWPMYQKVALLAGVLAPVAISMGFAFPTGLARVNRINPAQVPWAWAVNGCLSVISAPLAIVIAIESGFNQVMLLASAGYALAFLAALTMKKSSGV